MDATAQIDLSTPSFGGVSFLNPGGIEISLALSRVTRHHAVFEMTDTAQVLRTSQALTDFKLQFGGRIAFRGRAVITQLLEAGSRLVVEVSLDGDWLGPSSEEANANPLLWRTAFDGFLAHWQKHHGVGSEFKLLVADMQTFLADLRVWLEEVEAGLASADPPASDPDFETRARHVAVSLAPPTSQVLTSFFERFEAVASQLEPGLEPLHRAYARRLLNPELMCAPFLNRTFHKPLGYAGDYEMVNMLVGDRFVGKSLYARLVNYWFLEQPPAEAHRNRLDYLTKAIVDVTVRATSAQRPASILTLGCGPAHEVQRFIEQYPFADQARFTLIDFNQETLDHVRANLEAIKARHRRSTPIEPLKRSVNQILKDAMRGSQELAGRFDLVYCAGLFDYLSDSMCQRLSEILYGWVRPGGQFITTNVDASNPRQRIMDFIMDWHLIYRDEPQLTALRPAELQPDDYRVESDLTGVNIYFTARKPELACP